MKSKSKKYSVISLFAWCGGLDVGLKWGFTFLWKKYPENNFNVIWANDIDENACKTYEKYFWDKTILNSDIWDELDQENIPNSTDIVLWWFPCQDFSHAWKRLWFESKRGRLYQAMIEVIKKTKPKLFLAENVKWLLTIDNGNAIKQIIEDFWAIGYHINYELFLTANYWVPQMRERVIIVWTRIDILPKFIFPNATHTKENWINLKDTIWDLENIEEWVIQNHYWSKAKKNKWQWNKTVNANKPWPTMRSEHHGNIEFHWNESRRLSAREAARIQTFPDDFIFYPSTSSAYKQIWNAIPPVFWWNLANTIQNFLDINLK